MKTAYIVSPLRSPVGKAGRGGFRTKRPDDLAADVIRAVVGQSGVDPHLIEAAEDLGADEWQAMRQVVLPLAMPAILAGWLLSFTISLDDVVVSFFVTGPEFEVLPLKIYSMVRLGVKPEVNALASLMFAVSLLVVSSAQCLLQRK